MSDALITYLADHLAGSIHATELVKNMRDEHSNDSLGEFCHDILIEIERDRVVLEQLAKQVGGGPSPTKELTAWAGEKLSRLKLRQKDSDGLGTFEALEHLGLGILGKRALWRALATAASTETRLRGLDYEELIHRAEDQHAEVERKSLEWARVTLVSQPPLG